MSTYIAILRGINVGGARKLPMKELKALFEALGAEAVRTYIQSGNVVFAHKRVKPEAFAKEAGKRIREQFGFDVPVLIRSVAEWKAVAERNPFLKEKAIDAEKLHVTFLDAAAGAAELERIAAGNYGEDRFLPGERAVYLHCPNGYGNTKLNNTFFGSKLKRSATTRNWRTVNELLRLAQQQ